MSENHTELDTLDAAGIVALIVAEDARAPAAVAAQADQIAQLADIVVDRMRRGGRLIYVGAGTSGRLGALDAAEIPPTFGIPAGRVVALLAGGPAALLTPVEAAEDDTAQGERDLAALAPGADDVVLGIAASGRTPYVLGALAQARAHGCFRAALTCTPGSPLIEAADLAIVPDVGPEIIEGSTRMKAGTAQKLALNALSATIFIRLGHVHGRLMVDVRPTNAKLRARACDIVHRIAGIDEARARQLLELADWRVKIAVIMARAGVTPAEAQRLLDAAGGSLRQALMHCR